MTKKAVKSDTPPLRRGEIAKVWQLLEQVTVAARDKHLELTDTSGSGGVGFEPPGILSFLVLTINSLVRPFLTRAFFIS
ncbi:MAG TPA: hypothetical protein VF303_02775 [Candidatus Nanoarchaeia archaeon]